MQTISKTSFSICFLRGYSSGSLPSVARYASPRKWYQPLSLSIRCKGTAFLGRVQIFRLTNSAKNLPIWQIIVRGCPRAPKKNPLTANAGRVFPNLNQTFEKWVFPAERLVFLLAGIWFDSLRLNHNGSIAALHVLLRGCDLTHYLARLQAE